MANFNLQDLCLTTITNNFEGTLVASFVSGNATLQRHLNFFEQTYSTELMARLNSANMKEKYLNFILNRHIKKASFFTSSDVILHKVLETAGDLKALTDVMEEDMAFLDALAAKCNLGRHNHAENNFFREEFKVRETLPQRSTEEEIFLRVFARYVKRYVDLANNLLHLAADISSYDLTKLLLARGVDVTSRDENGRTALFIACMKRSLEIVKLLTEHSPVYIRERMDAYGDTPLDIACRCSSPEIVQYLLSKGCNVFVTEERGYGPILSAVSNVPDDAIHIANMLLDAGAEINHRDIIGQTALFHAAQNSANRSPAIIAKCKKYSYADLCLLLIERGIDVNISDNSDRIALHLAVKLRQEILVRKLLICGCDINKPDKDGFTPLFYACEGRSRRLVDLLISCGANLRAQNWEAISTEFLNDEVKQLVNYIVYKSKQCLSLLNLCIIFLRKKLRNVDKDAFQLGLPPFLVKCIQLNDNHM